MPGDKRRTKRRSCLGATIIICVLIVAGLLWGPYPPYFEPRLVFADSVSMDGGSGGDDWALGIAYESNQSVLCTADFTCSLEVVESV